MENMYSSCRAFSNSRAIMSVHAADYVRIAARSVRRENGCSVHDRKARVVETVPLVASYIAAASAECRNLRRRSMPIALRSTKRRCWRSRRSTPIIGPLDADRRHRQNDARSPLLPVTELQDVSSSDSPSHAPRSTRRERPSLTAFSHFASASVPPPTRSLMAEETQSCRRDGDLPRMRGHTTERKDSERAPQSRADARPGEDRSCTHRRRAPGRCSYCHYARKFLQMSR